LIVNYLHFDSLFRQLENRDKAFIDFIKTNIYGVKDNGIGISAEHQKTVFDMFKRLHSVAQYEGSGIGLAFCSRIVDTYGGEIWVESELGKGATFFFTLPNAPIIAVEKREMSANGVLV
jgi:signal transduction histidine kinase